MATKTAYQSQADRRTKTALKLRARFDAKARKYAASLVAALTGAADAKVRLDRINLLYGVDIATETLLVHELRTAGLGGTLAAALGGSTPGEEVQLFNPTPNGNEGAALSTEALFGEVAVVPGDASAKPPKEPKLPPKDQYDTMLTGPNEDAQGVTLAASAGDTLRFNALATGGSAPASMDISVGGTQVASVAYLDRYMSKAFSFAHAGVTHTGAFAATVNF